MTFWCFKPKLDDQNVDPKSFDGRYQKLMEDSSKLNRIIDLTEILSEIAELKLIVDKINSEKTVANKVDIPPEEKLKGDKSEGMLRTWTIFETNT